MRSAAANWADFTFDEFRGERHSEKVAIRARIGLGDELAGATSSLRVTLCVAPPAPCGDAHSDAAVAAVVEHHLAKDLRVLWMYLPTRNQNALGRQPPPGHAFRLALSAKLKQPVSGTPFGTAPTVAKWHRGEEAVRRDSTGRR